MSYTPTVWATGDVVTAEKLNKLEQGVASAGGGSGGGVMIVNDVNGTLDKTWQEIYDAGFSVIKEPNGLLMFCAGALTYDGNYIAPYFNPMLNTVIDWTASSANGYPSSGQPGPGPGPTTN